MTDIVERIITPMQLDEVARIKAQVEARWDEKPHYPGGGGILSPGCMFRAEEILSMIAALEDTRGKALEEAAKVAEERLSAYEESYDQTSHKAETLAVIASLSVVATAIRALVKP